LNNAPLWTPTPDRILGANLTRFTRRAEAATGRQFPTYGDLHRWSIDDPGAFWSLLWSFCGVVGDPGPRPFIEAQHMLDARFFPEATLNLAENLLRGSGPDDAIVFRDERGKARRLSWDELCALVSRIQRMLAAEGVGRGDRVAAMLPNIPEAVAFMLATVSLGAVWTSCSPDFGENGVLDRFGQIEPSIFVAADGYIYGGKQIDLRPNAAAIAARLPTVRRTIIVEHLESGDLDIPGGASLTAALAPFSPESLTFERVSFSHPSCIVYSSGTTGVPKCIVHSTGGILLQHLKEQQLHCDLREGDRLFYFTTLGWMMWNWLVAGLASRVTLLLYDGSPFAPDAGTLFDYADTERATHFGISAKYIDAVRKAGFVPREHHRLKNLRAMMSTGSPLSPEGFRFIHESIKDDMHLASISGGTDILSCFVLGVPTAPVWAGEIQAPGLGMAVDVWNESGEPVRGEKGELVCTRPFPSMPVGLWNDPTTARYRATYFERFDNIWHHGDFAEWTLHDGIVIHGRSDTTLNPGGVRIGTAEIYNQVEQLPEILESICVGQQRNDDVRIVLFVRLRNGLVLDEALENRIRQKIRHGASPRHVPARIVAIADIPRTKSGKLTELAVADIIHGRQVRNREALANPEALELFRDIAELDD
jgi:acetoacetyl-CoA synthetase